MRVNCVITGNIEQFLGFLREKGLKKEDWRYLDSDQQMRGMKPNILVWTGEYWKNPLWKDPVLFGQLKSWVNRYGAKVIWDKKGPEDD